MLIKLEISGIPFTKQSFRYGKPITTKKGITFTPKYQPQEVIDKTNNAVVQVKNQLPVGFIPFKNQVNVRKLLFCFPPLKSMSKRQLQSIRFYDEMGLRFQDGMYKVYKSTKPDIDNLEKHLWDALQGIVFIDDSIIVEKREVSKIYSMKPRIIIEIEGS